MSDATAPKGLDLTHIAPTITCDDLAESLRFYTEILGFEVTERWERDGQLLGVSLRAGKSDLMLSQDDWKKGRERKKGVGIRFYCSTPQNIDELAAQIQARGGKLENEPTDQPWGARDFAIVDPDGFAISISTEM
jgi:uncharacterized glyoxalase superfamily protein PhnB